ncbi:MAG: nucleotidyltransferase family protein [Nitrospirae bacterium]|nr:nucleotidyltransferase family protein [Nitrospirota bacterium]
MKALILAAGYGTRLYPLTKDKPKPLLPVAGKPMMEHILKKIEKIEEIDKVYVVTNEKFAGHFRAWKETYPGKKEIKIINDTTTTDENKLGAIGDMQLVVEKEEINDDLLVVAGDNLFDFDLEDFINFFKEKGASVGLRDIPDREAVKRYSTVELDEDKKILSFQEKPSHPTTTLVAICLYLFPKEKLNLISEYLKEGNNPDAPGFYIAWLHQKEPVYGFVFAGKWHDIGDLKCYEEANKGFK